MKLHHHTAFSLAASGTLYLLTKSWGLAIASFIAGIFIDLDHFIDYFREHGINLDIKKFFRICKNAQFNKIILLFHGWEWLIVICTIAWCSGWDPLMTGIVIGLSHHMILDIFYNSKNLRAYSIIWRWSKGFEFDTVFPNLTPKKYEYKNSLDRT